MSSTKIDNYAEAFEAHECHKDIAKAVEKGRREYEPKPFAVEFLGLYKVATVVAVLAGLLSVALGLSYVSAEIGHFLGLPTWAAMVAAGALMLAVEAAKAFALAKAAGGVFRRANTAYIFVFVFAAILLAVLSFVAATRGAEVAAMGLADKAEQAATTAAKEAHDKALGDGLAVARGLEEAQAAHFAATSWKGKLSAKNQGIYNDFATRIADAKEAARADAKAAYDEALGGAAGGLVQAERTGGFIWALSAATEVCIIALFLFASYYTYRAYVEAGLTADTPTFHNPTEAAPRRKAGVAGPEPMPEPMPEQWRPTAPAQAVGFQIGRLSSTCKHDAEALASTIDKQAQKAPEPARKGPSETAKALASTCKNDHTGSAYYWQNYPQLCQSVVQRLAGESTATWAELASRTGVSESTVYRCRTAIEHELATKNPNQ